MSGASEFDVRKALRAAAVEVAGWHEVESTLRGEIGEENEEILRPLVFAFGYMLLHDDERRRDEGPFAPAIVTDRGQYPPDLGQIDAGDIDAWRRAADGTDAPVIASRLRDLLWVAREGERPHAHAQAAIDAYLELSRSPTWPPVQQAYALSRAFDLALQLRDVDRQAGLTERAIEVIHADLADEEGGGPGVSLTLIAHLARLAPQPPPLLELVDAADHRYGSDPYLADTLADVRVSIPDANRDEVRRAQIQRWRDKASASEGILKATYLERALELATTHGVSDLVPELRLELQEMGPDDFDLKTIATEFQIPTKVIRQTVDRIVDDTGWERSLLRYGQAGPPGGDPAELDERIDELMEQAPIQFLVTKVVIAPDESSTLFLANTPETHRRLARAEQRAHAARFWSLIAVEAVETIRERHGDPQLGTLIEFFGSDFIDVATADRLAASVLLYLQGDFDEAAHLLVPRIESIIRNMARTAGIPIIREPSGPTPGRVMSLGPLLARLEPLFADAGWHAYLTNLLVDELGLNLRNVIAHGLRDRVDQHDAALLIQAVCYLRSLGVSSPD